MRRFRCFKQLWFSITVILAVSPVFICSAMEGDINGDKNVNLTDAILSIKVQAGHSIGDLTELAAEIDGDGRIGMAEALHALRVVAGVDKPAVMDIQPVSLFFSIDRNQESITLFNTAGGQLLWSIDDTSLPAWITEIDQVSGCIAGNESTNVTITVDRTGLDLEASYAATIPVASNGGDMAVGLTLGFEKGWSRSLGMGDYYTESHPDSIQQSSDGGYVFVFENIYGGAGDYEYGIAKLAADGSLQWARDFGGPSIEAPKAVIETSDRGYLVAGQSYSYRTGTRYDDIVLIKLDAGGSLAWQKSYGGAGYDDSPEAIAAVTDNDGNPDGYILAGATDSFGAGGRDIWLLRLENNGDIRWQKTLGGGGSEYARAIRTVTGGFLLAGSTTSFGAGGSDVWVVKIDADGALLWERAYGGTGPESPVGIEPTNTGGCVVGAGSGSFLPDDNFWVFEIDASGAVLWQYLYGGAGDDRARDFRRTLDGGYIMAGWTDSFGTEFAGTVYNDAWLIKLGPSGGIQWQKFYNKPHEYDGEMINAPDWAYSVTPTLEGGYTVVGDTDWLTYADVDRETDIWIFQVNSMGELGCGIDLDSDVVPDDSAGVKITGPNGYTITDTSVVPGTPSGRFFKITPEEFTHCGIVISNPVIDVIPESREFDGPYVGCDAVQSFTIRNTGTADLIVTGLDFEATTDEFSFDANEEGNGPLPWIVHPEEEVDVYIRFLPTDVSSTAASLNILSNDPDQPETTVQAMGAGLLYGENIDTFEYTSHDAVDILFTLDRSGSMTDDNALIVANFETFINELVGLNLDFHVAVAVEDDGCILGSDAYIDNTFSASNAASTFETMADIYITLGTYGADTERGFTLAEAALKSSNIGSGGCNEGFYREDAGLVIIHVSDEPEQSVNTWTFYVNQLLEMKDDPNKVIINAVAGDYPSGCESASPGTGYYEAALATDGLFLSICSTDWSAHLTQIAQKAAATRPRITLEVTQLPVPETIEMRVDGIKKTTGWVYDPAINSVVFDMDHRPSLGSTVEIKYHLMPDCEL